MNFHHYDISIKKISNSKIDNKSKERIIRTKKDIVNKEEIEDKYEKDFIDIYGNIIPLGNKIKINNENKTLDSSEVIESNEQNNDTYKEEISKKEYLFFLKEITEKINEDIEFIDSKLNILKNL